jgi:hypothetical protein
MPVLHEINKYSSHLGRKNMRFLQGCTTPQRGSY